MDPNISRFYDQSCFIRFLHIRVEGLGFRVSTSKPKSPSAPSPKPVDVDPESESRNRRPEEVARLLGLGWILQVYGVEITCYQLSVVCLALPA